jgi:hypothetical protein
MDDTIKQIIDKFSLEISDGCLDLREYSNEDAVSFLYALKELGTVLFHGTNAEERFSILEARQANDGFKESGNKKAVYADADVTVPLANALLNRTYLISKFDSFVTAWGDDNGKMIFNFSPNVYELFTARDPNLFSDGYVYILDKTNFINAEDAGAEWHAESDQIPLLACRVSKKLAPTIFIFGKGAADTVGEYNQ